MSLKVSNQKACQFVCKGLNRKISHLFSLTLLILERLIVVVNHSMSLQVYVRFFPRFERQGSHGESRIMDFPRATSINRKKAQQSNT